MIFPSTPRPPNDFLCPITKQIMIDPVVTRHGCSFERKAISKWIEHDGYNYCPVTGAPLRIDHLEPNNALQWKIRYWKMKNKYEENNNNNNDDGDVVQEERDTTTSNNKRIPLEKFLCPLTRKVMKNPVMTRHGNNFERNAILKWMIMRGEVCPVTGKSLKPSDLVTNTKLEWEIQNWENDSIRVFLTSEQQNIMNEALTTTEPTPQGQYTCLALNKNSSKKDGEIVDKNFPKESTSWKLSSLKKLLKNSFSLESSRKEGHHGDEDTISLCSSNKTTL